MKKLLLLCSFLMLFFSLSAQIEATETQMTLITKIAADWCPPCGGWGWDLFEGILEDNTEKAIVLAAHYSGGLQTDASKAFASNFGATSQPRFFVNNTDQNATSSNFPTVRQTIKTMVDDNALQSPVVQTGIEANYFADENNVSIQTNTQFFQDAEGDYYLGLYFIKKLLVAPQANQGDEAQHHELLQEEITPNAEDDFGTPLVSGTIASGNIYGSVATVNINTETFDYQNYEVAAIIWKKEAEKYIFVNGNRVDVDLGVTRTNSLAALESSFSIRPNIITNDFQLTFSAKEEIQNARIDLYNMEGQLIQNFYSGNLSTGEQTLQVQRPGNIASGVYLIKMSTVDGQVTKRVIFE